MAAAAEEAAPSEGPAGEGVEGDAATLPLLAAAAAAEEDEMVEEDVSVEEGLLLLRFLGEGPLR